MGFSRGRTRQDFNINVNINSDGDSENNRDSYPNARKIVGTTWNS
jgi:hypothetical protein